MTPRSSKPACGTVGKTLSWALSRVTAIATERRNCTVQCRVRCSVSPEYQRGRMGAEPSFRDSGLKDLDIKWVAS